MFICYIFNSGSGQKKMFSCILLLIIVLSVSCRWQKKEISSVALNKFSIGLQTIYVDKVAVDIYVPKTKQCVVNILVLPGWNFSQKKWHQNTKILQQANQYSACLIFPNMLKAIYASQYFKETKSSFFYMPSLAWIFQYFVPHLQRKYKLFMKGQHNVILGLSTGGRGVLQILIHQNKNIGSIFSAGASLSGDFDQTKMPNDKLIEAVYGRYRQFPNRWKTIDNPYFEVNALKGSLSLYLGHGMKDTIIPYEQTKMFYNKIKQINPNLNVILNLKKNGKHDFIYWNSELLAIFDFFTQASTD